jgi:hypothetical protein
LIDGGCTPSIDVSGNQKPLLHEVLTCDVVETDRYIPKRSRHRVTEWRRCGPIKTGGAKMPGTGENRPCDAGAGAPSPAPPTPPRDRGGRDASTSDDIREPVGEARLHELEAAAEAFEATLEAVEDVADDFAEALRETETRLRQNADARLAEIGLALDEEERVASLEPSESDLEQALVAQQRDEIAHVREAIEAALDDAERAASLEPPAADLLEQAEHAVNDATAQQVHDLAGAIKVAGPSGSLDPDQSSLTTAVEAPRAEAQARLRTEARAALDQQQHESATIPTDAKLVEGAHPAQLPAGPHASAPPAPPVSDQNVLGAIVAAHDDDDASPKQPNAPASPRRPERFGPRNHDEFGRRIEPRNP